MPRGYFTFVLHTHFPYVREAGLWPFGEETLHEVMAETYLPLLNALYDLREQEYPARLTLGITPILLEQLADPAVGSRFRTFLERELSAAQADLRRFEASGEVQRAELARFYQNFYRDLLNSYLERFGGDLVGAFRRLQEEGVIEILTSGATHGYLPLLERDSSIYGQLKVGVESYRKCWGTSPRGIWLPELGYRPPHMEGSGRYKPGLEEFLAELNIHYFFADTHALTGGPLLGKAAGDVRGPYAAVPRRILVIRSEERPEAAKGITFRPYFVHGSGVAVMAPNQRTSLQVWSATHGYPGDAHYREFHRKDEASGLQYWRVTGPGVDLGAKELYDPQRARERVQEHARHFVHLVREELDNYARGGTPPGIVIAAYDTELFGHWWFEGVDWLKEVLRLLARQGEVETTTASTYLERYPPQEVLALPESSWGEGGGHHTWLNPDTEWVWPLIYRAERWMEELAAQHPDAERDLREILNQAVRELLLLQSSDWPFLISTGQAQAFAEARFQAHLARFHHLALMAEDGRIRPEDIDYLESISELDNPFPQIDYRYFAEREGVLAP
ncbi:MAG: DUF1957 domain-containing protein [Chloroflexi bacterium]|nr:DUF1957 domain-containing protein [Chloroflexota bacterium]